MGENQADAKFAEVQRDKEVLSRGLRHSSSTAAVFPELPPVLSHFYLKVNDQNSFKGANTADFAREMSDAPERNAIEIGLKFSF